MSDTEYAVLPSALDSIVLGAAENAASSHGLTLSAPAKDFLLTKSVRSLDAIKGKGQIKEKRAEIERNTAQLIRYIVDEFPVPQVVRFLTRARGEWPVDSGLNGSLWSPHRASIC